MFLMNGLKKLKEKPFCNDFHLLLIGVILLFITLYNHLFIILFSIYLIFILLKTDYLKPLIILLIIFIIILIARYIIEYLSITNDMRGIVIEIKNEKSYVIRSGLIKLLIYDEASYSVGDIVSISGHINEIAPKGYPGDFDYKMYLSSKGIAGTFYVDTSSFIKRGFTLNSIKYNFLSYLEKVLSKDSFSYVASVVFAENLLDKKLKDSYSVLGISHILAISGMHIMILYRALSSLFLKLFHYYRNIIPLFIITIYVIIIGCPPSSLRALLFLIIGTINSKGIVQYTKLDILSISCLIMLAINPYQIYNVGFILSYLVSFILIYRNDLIASKGLMGLFKGYFLIYLITLPFIINMSNNISLISLILSPILTEVVGNVIIPISYALAIFPGLDFLFKYLFMFLNSYVLALGEKFFLIHMPYMNPYLIFGYYLILALIIVTVYRRRKIIFSIGLMLLFLIGYRSVIIYNPTPEVVFLDCGQGDATMVKEGDSIVLIDAFNSFDYLKDLGISKLEYLILTHSDSDHLGDYIEILDYFKVGAIIYPSFDTRLKEILTPYDNKIPIEAGYSFKLKDFEFNIISPLHSYDTPNKNSIAIKLEIYNMSFLLCADITMEVESDLIDRYGSYLKSDILKVGHHGSSTSSSMDFLRAVAPKYSIISAGLNNKYHHPDLEVCKRLNSLSIVYNTINDGSITFKVYEDHLRHYTYR